ncbi:protein kinase [Kutzneria sp. NPDC052558]|uniref:nSTAND1 domain-containing NTPase n=1 Tax=Kutzneria sp. NPDC052558 TaxID=3364121 RepID=UPI0037CA3351
MVSGAASSEESTSAEFGPYRILGLLGQGGMGVVHRAHDIRHDRVIALKRLPVSLAEHEFRARFRREARIVAGLRHPNVIPVNDFGEIDGQLFLDMMLVDGTDLRRAAGAGTVDPDRAVQLLTQVAAALDAAHADGLVHRDVKPSNILIDRDGHAFLADFGIARDATPEATALTASGQLLGSWDYMAPERLSGGPVDGRADQYSLACVLFECLTGRLPHPAIDPAAKVAAHLLQPPPAPSVFAPTVTPALDTVVMRGLAKDPARRFPTATALMTAARSASYAGETRLAPSPTRLGPAARERDQAHLVRAILRATADREPAARPRPDQPPPCPYPGLRGFDRADADWFHGRSRVVADLLVRLAEQLDTGEPVVLIGASGAGKSSVLCAGLLPAIAAADRSDQRAWPQIVLTPGADPIGALATALAARTSVIAEHWAAVIRDAPAEFGALCAGEVGSDPIRPVIVVDQFEELFTHGVPEPVRRAFATALANAQPALVVLAVRADQVERCIELAPLVPALNSPVLLGPMDTVALREAIVRPAHDVGVEVEPGLAERLIADLGVHGDAGYDPGALPRLAHALRETWNRSDERVLTLAAYRLAGGIAGAVARTAEEIYAQLDPAIQRALRTMLLGLVAVSEDGALARRRVDPGELVAAAGGAEVLDRLIAARLVTVDEFGARLAHEALLSAWPRLRDWIDEDRAGLVQHRRFAEAVQAWVESGEQADDLYRGVRLATLTSWLESAGGRVRLHPVEQDFLARSSAAEQAAALATRRRTRRLRVLVAALSVLLVVASVTVVVATRLRQDALNQQAQAEAAGRVSLSRQLAAESELYRGVDPLRLGLSALGAWQAGQTVEARSAVLNAQQDSFRGEMAGHTSAATSVTVSADGRVAVSGGQDGTLRLWDVPNRRAVATLATNGSWYHATSMSADGRLLVALDADSRMASLWDLGRRAKIFTPPGGESTAGAVSADGRLFAAATTQGLGIWDTSSFARLALLPVTASAAMKFSPDGAMIAVGDQKDIDVYRVSDGTKLATLSAATSGFVMSVDFDRNADQVVSCTSDGAVQVWRTSSWTQAQALRAASSDLDGGEARVSPDGRLVVASGGKTGEQVQVWDTETGQLLQDLTPPGQSLVGGLALTADGHTMVGSTYAGPIAVWALGRSILPAITTAAVTATAFQPRGHLLVTATGDNSIRLWDTTTEGLVRSLTGDDAEVDSAVFSPDGRELATADKNGTLVVWDPATGAELHRYVVPDTNLMSVAFSPDGAKIAVSANTTTNDATQDKVLLLKTADLSVLAQHATAQEPHNDIPGIGTTGNSPGNVAFSPDGHTLAVAMLGGRIGLWDMADPAAAWQTLRGHDGPVTSVAYSPDGKILASGGNDNLVRFWRVGDGQPVGAIAHNAGAGVRQIAFSPDGATLATIALDTVLRLWDVRTLQPIAQLDRSGGILNDVAFDPSGQRVATASADGATRLWDVDTDDALRALCGLVDRATLAQQWAKLGPDHGPAPTCR